MDAVSTRVVLPIVHGTKTFEVSDQVPSGESKKRAIEASADQKSLATAPEKNVDDSSKHHSPTTESPCCSSIERSTSSLEDNSQNETVTEIRLNTATLRHALNRIRSRLSSKTCISLLDSSLIAASTTATNFEFKDSGKFLRKGRKRKVSVSVPNADELGDRPKKRNSGLLSNEINGAESETETQIEYVTEPTDRDILMGKNSHYDLPANVAYRKVLRSFRSKAKSRRFQGVANEAIEYICNVLGARFLRLVSGNDPQERWKVLTKNEARVKVIKAMRELKTLAYEELMRPDAKKASAGDHSVRPGTATEDSSNVCKYCGRTYTVLGFWKHTQSCAQAHRKNKNDRSTKESLFSLSPFPSSFADNGEDKGEVSAKRNADEQKQENTRLMPRNCRYCLKLFNIRGVVTHEKSCAKKLGIPYTGMAATDETMDTGSLKSVPNDDACCDISNEELETKSQPPTIENPPIVPSIPINEGDLVWVTQGKTDHMAMYVGKPRNGGGIEEVQVKWTTNRLIQYVPRSTVRMFEMSNERRGRQRSSRREMYVPAMPEAKRSRRQRKTQNGKDQGGKESNATETKACSQQHPPVVPDPDSNEKVKSVFGQIVMDAKLQQQQPQQPAEPKKQPHAALAKEAPAIIPTDRDVISGRHNIRSHPGNRTYRDLVRRFKEIHGSTYENKDLATKLFDHLRDDIGGRFLDYDPVQKSWEEATIANSTRKIHSALQAIDFYERSRTNDHKLKRSRTNDHKLKRMLSHNDVIIGESKDSQHPGNIVYHETILKFKRENPSGNSDVVASKVIDHIRHVLHGEFVGDAPKGWFIQPEKEVKQNILRSLFEHDCKHGVEPAEMDIFCSDDHVGNVPNNGNGNNIGNHYEHLGNRRFRSIVAANEKKYHADSSTEDEKKEICWGIFNWVSKYGARFLYKDDVGWKKMSDVDACSQIDRAFALRSDRSL